VGQMNEVLCKAVAHNLCADRLHSRNWIGRRYVRPGGIGWVRLLGLPFLGTVGGSDLPHVHRAN